ncbi:MAG: polyprenyl synthetase family protein [Planctomycetaceae bacterium]
MTADSKSSWDHFRPLINARLEKYLTLAAECPPQLQQAMAYSLLADGKRMRPLLVLLACEACGGDVEAALPAACALEMVHTYSLIHDDLPTMDDDDYRRGRLTNHKVYGEALAILAGDALLTLAFQIVADDVHPPEVAAACCADLAKAAGMCGMVGGQVADLEAEQTEQPTLSQLEGIHRRKTGRLLTSALTLGGRIAQTEQTDLAKLSKYGDCIGLAFQIVDDLLDLRGEQEKLGKSVQKDAQRGKLTYPALLGETESRQRAGALVAEAVACLEPFGERGRRLASLAHFVLERDH